MLPAIVFDRAGDESRRVHFGFKDYAAGVYELQDSTRGPAINEIGFRALEIFDEQGNIDLNEEQSVWNLYRWITSILIVRRGQPSRRRIALAAQYNTGFVPCMMIDLLTGVMHPDALPPARRAGEFSNMLNQFDWSMARSTGVAIHFTQGYRYLVNYMPVDHKRSAMAVHKDLFGGRLTPSRFDGYRPITNVRNIIITTGRQTRLVTLVEAGTGLTDLVGGSTTGPNGVDDPTITMIRETGEELFDLQNAKEDEYWTLYDETFAEHLLGVMVFETTVCFIHRMTDDEWALITPKMFLSTEHTVRIRRQLPRIGARLIVTRNLPIHSPPDEDNLLSPFYTNPTYDTLIALDTLVTTV
jgi:hypothetical protein